MSETLKVALGERAYDIMVGERLLLTSGQHIKPLMKGNTAFIVTDETVARLYLHRLTASLEEAGIRSKPIILPAGESTKSLSQFGQLLEQMLEQKPDRNTMIIALGGGVIGDIAGFAASALLRGVDFIQIPTTLLSQIDSSVGGKTGINSKYGKNLIGSFYQPRLVLADVSLLTSLPKRELLSGYAEMIKYGLINDAEFFRWLDKNLDSILSLEPKILSQAIVKCCAAKAAIVAADEREQNARALLNLGHTFGHAFEAETGFGDELLHGEAVGLGMAMAFELSTRMGLCKAEETAQTIAHLKRAGLRVAPKEIRASWDVAKLMDHFTRDKKASGGNMTFILARGIGQSFVCRDVNKDLLEQLLKEMCA